MDLQPRVRELLNELMRHSASIGYPLRVTETVRPFRLVRAAFGVEAKPGFSYHNYGLAFDVIPVAWPLREVPGGIWELIGVLGKKLGLRWGGDFSRWDPVHFDYPVMSVAQLYRIFKQTGKIPLVAECKRGLGQEFSPAVCPLFAGPGEEESPHGIDQQIEGDGSTSEIPIWPFFIVGGILLLIIVLD